MLKISKKNFISFFLVITFIIIVVFIVFNSKYSIVSPKETDINNSSSQLKINPGGAPINPPTESPKNTIDN